MLDDEENPYIGFADLIEKNAGLDRNILEVGCGIYPCLSDVISKRQQKIGCGTITAYDPLLSKSVNLEHITLIKDEFYYYTDVSKYDLIISKEPCSATKYVLYAANEKKKDVIISPCDCATEHLPEWAQHSNDMLNDWYEYVYNQLKGKDCTVEKFDLDKKYNYSNPIYYKKHIKIK